MSATCRQDTWLRWSMVRKKNTQGGRSRSKEDARFALDGILTSAATLLSPLLLFVLSGIFGSALQGQSCDVFNLGTGNGVSVLEMISAAEHASGKKLPYQVTARRTGDIATCYADASKANKLLHWQAKKTVQEAVADSWRWQSQNPMGFNSE
jgi:hypothetical protein